MDRPSRGWELGASLIILFVALIAWLVMLALARDMPDAMMSPASFLVFWVVMMIAMMFPSVAPTAILWVGGIARTSSGIGRFARAGSFIAGYLVVWTAYGLAALAAIAGAATLVQRAPESARWVGAGVFAFAALYQITPLKHACLRHCRSPLAAMMQYAGFPRYGRDVLAGLHHGTFCVGCCWALMASLVAAGFMNFAAMAAIAALIFLEKRWVRGELFARVAGVGLLALAVLAILHPELFPGLRPAMPG